MTHYIKQISGPASTDRAGFKVARNFQRVTQICAIFAMATGSLTFLAWILKIPSQTLFIEKFDAMAITATPGCFFAGIALMLLGRSHKPYQSWVRKLVRVLCVLTMTFCALVMLDYFFVWDTGLNRTSPMSYQTGLSLILISFSLLLLDWEPIPAHRPAQYLAMLAAMFPLQTFINLVNKTVYGFNELESARQMSASAALAVLALALGVLTARPSQGFMKIAASDSLAGQIIRRLLFPLIVSVPVLSLSIGTSAGVIFDPLFASSAFVMIIIVLFTIMTWVTAETIHSAEKKLLASEKRYKMASRATRDAIWDWDLASNELTWNEAIHTEYRHPEDRMKGVIDWWYQHIHPEDVGRVVSGIHQVIESGLHYWSDEYRFLKGDGSYRDVLDRGYVEHDSAGKPIRVIGAMQDQTARKNAEKALRESEDRFRQIFEKAPVGIAEVDPLSQRFLRVNAAYSQMFGYAEADLCAMTVEQSGLPLLDDCADLKTEHPFVRQDGKTLWASIGSVNIRGLLGEPLAHIVIAQDITERRSMEEVNRLSEERLKMALTASQIGFYDWDIQHNLIMFDPRMSQDWGIVEPARTMEAALALIHPDDQEFVQAKVNESVNTGRIYLIEYRVVRPVDGRVVWMEVRGEVHKDQEGIPKRFVGTCLNITARKLAEQKLLENEARFRQFAEAMPQMAFVADPQGNMNYFNQRHYEYFGLDPTDEQGLQWAERNLHHPDDRQRTIDRWTESVLTESDYQIEYRLRRFDGEYRWHLGRAVPVRNCDGAVIQWLGTNTDIHEHKLVSQKLQENEAKFRIIADAMPQMVWSTLPDGFHDYYNQRWYEFTGVPEGTTDGDGWNNMFHPDDQGRAWEAWKHSLDTGDPYEIEYRLRHRSGQYRWTLGRALPVRNEQGEMIRWMGTCTDIHDQKLASEVLAASEAKLRAILSQLPVGVVIADVDGQIATTNESFRQIWGGVLHVGQQRYHEYEGYWFDTDKKLESQDWALARALKHRKVILNEVIRLKGFNGQERIILNAAAPILTETGELTGAIAVVQDITAQKNFEAELGLAKDEAVRANLAKSQFLANMSHEIRSPMNSVMGYADLLTEPGLDDGERMMYASRIKASGAHLLHIIDDILDLSKVESGHFQIEWRRFSVVDLIAECVQSMSILAQRKKIELILSCDTAIPQFIESDSIRFRQILMNIIGNAIKFTQKGQVRVGLRFQEKSARGPALLVVDVEDTGIGISPEQQKELFQPFMQSDASITRKFGGTGLGLHLSRRLAEALGGHLKLTWSVPGQGSCFTIRVLAGELSGTDFVASFDLNHSIQLAGAPVDHSLGGPIRVLIVDDNADNQALMKAYLRKADVQMDTAVDGEKALLLASRNSYDIILMDVMMPVMDGLEATRRLRSQGYSKPIIALTAHAMKEEVEKSLAAGCDGHLSKPVDIKELLTTMRRFVDLSQRNEQQILH